MLLRLHHSYLWVGEGTILLATPLFGIIGGVVRRDLRRGYHRGCTILLATIESARSEPVLRWCGWLGCWCWPCRTLGHISYAAIWRLAKPWPVLSCSILAGARAPTTQCPILACRGPLVQLPRRGALGRHDPMTNVVQTGVVDRFSYVFNWSFRISWGNYLVLTGESIRTVGTLVGSENSNLSPSHLLLVYSHGLTYVVDLTLHLPDLGGL